MKNLHNVYINFEKHLMSDEKPSEYFIEFFENDSSSKLYPLTMLNELKKIDQSLVHHPEGNVWNHTMLVVDNAAIRKNKSNNPKIFMWSSLLHDLGKIPATKIRKGRITAYDHDKYGEKLCTEFLNAMGAKEEDIYKTSKMVRWHMQILYVVKDLPFADIKGMLNDVDLDDIALLSLCDRLGRGNMTNKTLELEKNNMNIFIEKCEKLQRLK